jgi:surface polysaccharide O-acyltransferase-like enzyme
MCNGYLLCRKDLNVKRHYFRTIKIFIIGVIWAFINALLTSLEKENLTLSSVRKELVEHGFWFIYALTCIYLVFPLFYFCCEHSKSLLLYLLVGIFCFTFVVDYFELYISYANRGIVPRIISPILQIVSYINPFKSLYAYTFVYFLAGGMVACYETYIKMFKTWTLLITLVASFLFLNIESLFKLFVFNIVGDQVWDGYKSIFTILFTCSFFILAHKQQQVFLNGSLFKGLIVTISNNTLGIYIISTLLIGFIENKQMVIMVPVLLHLIIATTIMMVSLEISLLIRKIPYIKKVLEYR